MPPLYTLQLSYVRPRKPNGIFVLTNLAIGLVVWLCVYLLVKLCL